MYKRVVATVAVALFSLLALVAGIVTDLHDRTFPQAIEAQSRLGLGFGDSQLTDREAFLKLAQWGAEGELGLVKIAPDLTGDSDERVFVALDDRELPSTFGWFSGNGVGSVVSDKRLANSSPDGSYLVTGDNSRLPDLERRLRDAGVQVTRTDASVTDSLRFAMGEGGFRAAVLAVLALIAALSLFWLSMKARSRALRVLGGSPTLRIQAQDLGGFAGVLIFSAAVVCLSAAAYVARFHGLAYVRPFAEVLVILHLGVIASSLLAALAMSALAWPSATVLATRQPAVSTLRSAAIVVQVLTFLLLVAAAGPTWSAHQSSSATAAEMAQWKRLADQVAIQFGMSDQEMSGIESQIGNLVDDAESAGVLAYSYTFTKEQWGGDLGGYSGVSFVNQRWLDLLTGDAFRDALKPVPYERVQGMLAREFGETLTLLSRDSISHEQIFAELDYREPIDGFQLPIAEGGGGNLQFLDDVLVAVVPSLHTMINDRNLTSMISTRNVLFTNVSATQTLLERHGLGTDTLLDRGFRGELNVVYVAEEGILRAQFLAYVVWLMTLSLVALIVAFAVAAAISAVISSLVHAKRDFPLRLTGHSWALILQGRVARQLLVGAGLVAVVVLFQSRDEIGAVLAVALFGVLVVPLSHLFAAHWSFASVSKRRV